MRISLMEKRIAATRLPRYRRASTPPPMQLTARDIRVVTWVYEMRFLTREQVQNLEFSPSTASYCKRRLALLYHNGYVDRKFIPSVGSFGSTRAVYCLTTKGARLVAHEMGSELRVLDWRKRSTHRELYFLKHTLGINDFRICMIRAADHLKFALDWTDERTLRRLEARDYVADPKIAGSRLAVVPDGYFRLARDGAEVGFALELDRATVEEKPFKAKVRTYGEWKRSGLYRKRYGLNSLRVLFVLAPNPRDPHRLARMKRWTEAEGGRSLFWFASLDALAPMSILEARIWQVAGRDGRFALLNGGHAWSGGTPQPVTFSQSHRG